MSQNWMRHFELQIVDNDGKGISLSDFKVMVRIECADTRWPRVANVTVYNLSPDTQNRIMGKEFAKIRIIAGYDGIAPAVPASEVGKVREVKAGQEGQTNGLNYGLIFQGDIRFTVTGRDNVTDSWIRIQACGENEAFIYASVKTTLAAGWTAADLHAVSMKSFNAYGVTQGATGEMPPNVFPRGRVIYKSTRDVMDDVAGMCRATWQMMDGKLQMVSEDKYLYEAIKLNADTGLIGQPQQTMGGGVNVRCLLNPNIKIHGLIEIDQASVYRTALDNQEIARSQARANEVNNNGLQQVQGTVQNPASIATDGVYIVKAIDYTLDTRGQPWYMDMMCFARGAADLQANTSLNRTF